MECIVSVSGVWKRFREDGGWVLRGVDLCVEPGRAVLITGPNGSGKTTLLRIILGLTRPTRGEVRVQGLPPTSPAARVVLGAVLHHSLLYDELTVSENLAYYAKLYGIEDYEPARDETVEALGLKQFLDRKAGELSFGWRKRADIARALIHSPKVLVIDEPFTGLDRDAVEAVKDLLEGLVARGSAVVAAAPQSQELLADSGKQRVYSLKSGLLALEGAENNGGLGSGLSREEPV